MTTEKILRKIEAGEVVKYKPNMRLYKIIPNGDGSYSVNTSNPFDGEVLSSTNNTKKQIEDFVINNGELENLNQFRALQN